MSRVSTDQYSETGKLLNGFDYTNQAWVRDGVYQKCWHPEEMNCHCYGTLHAGEKTNEQN